MSAVLIYVTGGVVEVSLRGRVKVGVIDFDNLKAGDKPPTLYGEVLDLARKDAGLKEGRDFYGPD